MTAPLPTLPPLPGRLLAVLRRPGTTLAAAAAHRAWPGMWAVVLMLALAPGAWLLSTPVGRQALVDERVRVVESLGGTITDAAYAQLQADPPLLAYATSGGRVLLWPPLTLVTAALVLWLARRSGRPVAAGEALAVAVHASVPLALGQLLALPAHLIRESLTSPFNLAAVTPGLDEGTLAARALGAVEVPGLWWLALVALGAARLSGRPARGLFGRLLAAYVGIAVLLAAGLALAAGGA